MIRLEKRPEPLCNKLSLMGLSAGAVILAMLLGGLLFLPFDANPVEGFASFIGNAFFTQRGMGFTLVAATPLILISLGTIVSWRCGFVYLGFEGCLLMGAAGTTMISLLSVKDGILAGYPPLVVIPLALACGVLFGMVWAGSVSEFKVRFGGNEVLIALMMNFLAMFVVQYLVVGPWRVEGDLPQTMRIPSQYWLPYIWPGTRCHAGILIALFAGGIIYLLMEKTRVGYEMITSGLNQNAALYGGTNVGMRLRQAAYIAGGLAGLAGGIEILGIHHRLLDGLSEGTGFLGIVTALLGNMKVLGAIVASVLYGGLSVGGDAMQRYTGLPSSIVLIIQAAIVLLLLASEVLRTHSVRWSPGRKLEGK